MARGEVGSLTRGGFGADEHVRVDFAEGIKDAVVMLTSTNNGGDEFSLVVTSVDEKGFTFRIDEWEDQDGPHPAVETINWLAVTPGVHELPDGRILEAGTAKATTDASSVDLNGAFAKPPVVLTNRMSENDADVADSDPFGITAKGFNLALQEGSRSDGINTGETVGYIAISVGGSAKSGAAIVHDDLTTNAGTFDLGASFEKGVSFAETQTLNEKDAGNVQLRDMDSASREKFFFDEESGDNETSHATESVGIVTFEYGIIPCFTKGCKIMTMTGEVDVSDLAPGALVLTRDHGFQRVKWISHTRLDQNRLSAQPDLGPVLIRKGSIAPGQPVRDMHVSPQHRMLFAGWKAELLAGQSEVLIPAKSLIDGVNILQPRASQVDYYHLLCDRHEVIYANGAPSETLHAAQIDKSELTPASRAALLRLCPDLDFGFGAAVRPCLTVKQGRVFAA